jgi:F0F1-type ATP synthase membrane subunit c/vacuolar-type H+-ATPase subunit K
MLTNAIKAAAAPQVRVMNIIWGAFMAAAPIYVFVASVYVRSAAPAAEEGVLQMVILEVAAVAALVLAVASFLYPRWAFGPGLPADPPRWAPSGGAQAPDLSDSDRRALSWLAHYQSTLIVVWALREGVVVLGLVVTIVRGQFNLLLPFAAAALVLLALGRPRPHEYLEDLRTRV